MANKENTLKNKIKKMKETARGKAILQLIRWAIFFIILFIILIIASLNKPKNVSKEPEEVITNKIGDKLSPTLFNEIKDQILNKNYDYQYEITDNSLKYIFNGTKKGEIETGYKEDGTNILKYYIDSTGIYEDALNNKIPLDNLYTDLKIEYMNKENLLNYLETKELSLIDTSNLVYYLKENNIEISISLKDNIIEYIRITSSDPLTSYDYYFTYRNVEVS